MSGQIHGWEIASAAFFTYSAVVSAGLSGLTPGSRRAASLLSLAGLLLAAVSVAVPPSAVFDNWIVPPALLLTSYWASGRLFVSPMSSAEGWLARTDQRLGVVQLAARTPRLLAEYLEVAYCGVYPLIPAALALHFLVLPHPDPSRFWTVILVTDFVCFGFLPWVQTRPPRALESSSPWRSVVRRFNERLLGTASIHVNTFPSGHAAEAIAVALLLAAAPWPIAAAMFIVAASITAGAVLGRYHYTLDAVAGWIVALAVWGLSVRR